MRWALWPCLASPAAAEACAVWQWYRSLLRVLPGTKEILRLNMDETSVAAFHGDAVGNIAKWKKRWPAAEPIVWADRKKRRTAYTHCAFICDDPALQPRLPQLILANESTMKVADLRRIQEILPSNVFVKRLKSSWINHCQMLSRAPGDLDNQLHERPGPGSEAVQGLAARIHLV